MLYQLSYSRVEKVYFRVGPWASQGATASKRWFIHGVHRETEVAVPLFADVVG